MNAKSRRGVDFFQDDVFRITRDLVRTPILDLKPDREEAT